VTVLYQNYLYTTMPETTLVVLVVLALARFERTNARRDLALFFLGCATLVYLRSVFHPFWFLAVVALVGWWASRRIGPKRVAAVAAVPVVLVAGLSLKNELVFGDPGTSSWLGMSLARLTTYPLNGSPELQELRGRGEVDDLARVRDAWRAYLASPSSLLSVQQNRAAVTGIDEAWRLVAYGERPSSFDLPAQEPDKPASGS
jgi:hypothetical protein